MKTIQYLCFAVLLSGVSASAATSFSQCPAIGADTSGCELLITVTAASGGSATAFTVGTSSPDLGPYDGSDDTLIGIQNNSGSVLNSISLSSSTDLFGFEGDGACSSTYAVASCNGGDPTGYAPKGVTFSNINSTYTNGTVNFAGGIAAGGSGWFSLEEALTAGQINPGTPSAAPEPSSIALLGLGLGGIVTAIRKRQAAK